MAALRDQLKRATQQRVVGVAGRLFRERGFAATTVREIAEASGVSVGSVMAVGDKNALLVRVFDSLVAAEHAKRASPETGNGACVDRLIALVLPFIEIFTDRSDLARTYASILVSGSRTSSLFTELASRLVTEFGTAITVRGCTEQADESAKAAALYLAYAGTLFTSAARGATDPVELEAGLRATFSAICTCKE